jgi:hypothetical protein
MIADPTAWPEIADVLSQRAAVRMGRAQTAHRTDVALDYERIGIDVQGFFNGLHIAVNLGES